MRLSKNMGYVVLPLTLVSLAGRGGSSGEAEEERRFRALETLVEIRTLMEEALRASKPPLSHGASSRSPLKRSRLGRIALRRYRISPWGPHGPVFHPAPRASVDPVAGGTSVHGGAWEAVRCMQRQSGVGATQR